MKDLLYYNIIPLTNIPVSNPQFFTYASDQELKIGQEVKVSLRGRQQRAIVYQKVKNKPKFRVLRISAIVSPEVVVNKEQFKLAKKISRYYHESLALAVRLFVPSQGKRELKVARKVKQSDSKRIRLNSEQTQALKIIAKSSKTNKFLLFGVTGSGKTEIYLKAIARILKQDKLAQVLVLVPEISLTPQAMERYEARFGLVISLWHSQMTKLAKWNEWLRVKNSKAQVVIGPRSALFAPWQNLKLIIIDECHDTSFKQYDPAPRYDARTVAGWLAVIHQVKIISGSATPKIEDYYKAKTRAIKLLKLTRRADVAKGTITKPPQVKIVDMRQELAKGNFSIFSETLKKYLDKIVVKKQQALLFINRRGSSSFVMCRQCGFVAKCKNCDVPLVYHRVRFEALICHHCGLHHSILEKCPDCQSKYIKFFGIGTQRIEVDLKELYPKIKIARMDRDSTSKRGQYKKIYEDFKAKKVQILIGTQMIAKGWDLPSVALVGIIAADLGLFFPDFRVQERVFSLLTQVAGRTGRGQQRGLAILQTYQPDSFVIKTAAKQNYPAFYKQEIRLRKELGYPPFSRLVKLFFVHKQPWRAESEAKKLAKSLRQQITKDDLRIELLGPAPMFIAKLRNYWRWQIVLRSRSKPSLDKLLSNVPSTWKIDVDPEDLL